MKPQKFVLVAKGKNGNSLRRVAKYEGQSPGCSMLASKKSGVLTRSIFLIASSGVVAQSHRPTYTPSTRDTAYWREGKNPRFVPVACSANDLYPASKPFLSRDSTLYCPLSKPQVT